MNKKPLIEKLHKKMIATQIEMVQIVESEQFDNATWLEGYYKALSDIVILIKKEGINSNLIKKAILEKLKKKMETTHIEMHNMIERDNMDDALWLEGYFRALSDIKILIKKEWTKRQ